MWKRPYTFEFSFETYIDPRPEQFCEHNAISVTHTCIYRTKPILADLRVPNTT